jgi:hypothetical protein
VHKIGKSNEARLQPLAVLTLNSCGHAPAPCRYPRSFLPPAGDTAIVRLEYYSVTSPPVRSRQRGAEPAGCHAHQAADVLPNPIECGNLAERPEIGEAVLQVQKSSAPTR